MRLGIPTRFASVRTAIAVPVVLAFVLALALVLGTATTHAEPRAAKAKNESGAASCLRELKRLGVHYRSVRRRGIDIGVRVLGDIAGVSYNGYKKQPLILDCSLVVSLARMGPHMAALGIQRVTYSSAYQRRHVRGTRRLSKHSFGLALDVHAFAGDDLGILRVRDDYEQGLGDLIDCIGQPLTPGGATLRTLACQFERSGLFHSVLTPDYDTSHYNHYHLEAAPWSERGSLPDERLPAMTEHASRSW